MCKWIIRSKPREKESERCTLDGPEFVKKMWWKYWAWVRDGVEDEISLYFDDFSTSNYLKWYNINMETT